MKQYSTFDGGNFYIKQFSTLPVLKLPLIQSLMEQYDITEDMLDNVGVTFSMKNAETGRYKIANVPGELVVNENREEFPDETKYTLVYKFKIKDTNKIGRYVGEFKLDFLGEYCGKITLPNNKPINIIISDTITKTSVI